MSATYYTLPKLKELALNTAKKIESSYTIDDVERSYTYAVSRCGYSNPIASDTDYAPKQHWLLRMMALWCYYDQLAANATGFDVEGIKLNQVVRNLRDKVIDPEEQDFQKAKEDPNFAHLLVDAGEHFASMTSQSSGIEDDAVGTPYYGNN